MSDLGGSSGQCNRLHLQSIKDYQGCQQASAEGLPPTSRWLRTTGDLTPWRQIPVAALTSLCNHASSRTPPAPGIAALVHSIRLSEEPLTHPAGWATLSGPARAYRFFHAAWSVAGMASLGYIWFCAATRRRNRRLTASIAFLSVEGAGLIIGGGDCPLEPFQQQLGDPVSFFELILPSRAAKAGVPILAFASVAGMVAMALRPPRR